MTGPRRPCQMPKSMIGADLAPNSPSGISGRSLDQRLSGAKETNLTVGLQAKQLPDYPARFKPTRSHARDAEAGEE
jgi:hypothetical protein